MRLLAFAFLTIGCSTHGLSPDAPDLAEFPDLAPVLPDGVHSLSGIDEMLPDDDLQPLDSILGDAKNVGFGESVHTTGGYTQAKFRVIKYLVEKKGFRAIGWEWQRVDGQVVEDYIVDGKGTARRAAQGHSVLS
jgi:erythromycin esterase